MSIHEAPDENDDDDGLSHSLDFYAKREEPRCVTMLNSDFFFYLYTLLLEEKTERVQNMGTVYNESILSSSKLIQ